MVIRKIVLSMLIIATVVETPTLAYSGELKNETIIRIASLAKQSQVAGESCKAFLDTLRKGTQDSERKEFYVSRASALNVLNQAERYPGTPLATSEAMELFLTMNTSIEGPQARELRAALSSLSDCHAAEFYGVLTRLIHPVSQRWLTAEERVRARNLVLSYVRREAWGDAKPPIQTVFITKLLSQSVSNGVATVSLQGYAELAALKWRVQEYQRKSTADLAIWEKQGSVISTLKSNESVERKVLASMSQRFEEAEDIRYDLQDFINSESGKGNLLPESPFLGGHLASLP